MLRIEAYAYDGCGQDTLPIKRTNLIPIGSMYGIFTYMFQKNQPNVGKYTIHGSYGICFLLGTLLELIFVTSICVLGGYSDINIQDGPLPVISTLIAPLIGVWPVA